MKASSSFGVPASLPKPWRVLALCASSKNHDTEAHTQQVLFLQRIAHHQAGGDNADAQRAMGNLLAPSRRQHSLVRVQPDLCPRYPNVRLGCPVCPAFRSATARSVWRGEDHHRTAWAIVFIRQQAQRQRGGSQRQRLAQPHFVGQQQAHRAVQALMAQALGQKALLPRLQLLAFGTAAIRSVPQGKIFVIIDLDELDFTPIAAPMYLADHGLRQGLAAFQKSNSSSIHATPSGDSSSHRIS